MGDISRADLRALEEATCKQDRIWMMQRHFVIQNKMGQLQLIDPIRPAQLVALKAIQNSHKQGQPARLIVGKSRKKGLSTIIAADAFCEYLLRDVNVMIVAHEKDLAEKLLAYMHRFYKYLDKQFTDKIPPIRKPPLYKGQTAKDKIKFEGYEAEIWVGTAKNVYAGTGMTPQYLFCTEVAKWDTGAETAISLLQSVAYKPGTTVVHESTFNGEDTLFYPMWRDAHDNSRLTLDEKGDPVITVNNPVKWNHYVPFFTGAADDPDIPLDFASEAEKARFSTTLTEEEQMWADKFEVSLEFLNGMRVIKTSQCNSRDLVRAQEYCFTPEEAVIASGAQRFNIQKLNLMQAKYQEVGERGELYYSDRWDKRIMFRRDSGGYMIRYKEPVAGHRYIATCDTAEGKLDSKGMEQDATVVHVFDFDYGMEQVAVIYGSISSENIISPLAMIGEYYYKAFMVIENNSSGAHTCIEMGKLYPRERLYHSGDIVQDARQRLSREIGFKTTVASKGPLIGHLGEAIESDAVIFHCEKTYDELRHYINKPGGGTSAAPGYHDDHVMAAALGILGAQSRPVLLDGNRKMDNIERFYQLPKKQNLEQGRNPISGY